MAVFLDQNGLVPALEQVTRPAVALIEALRIDAVQLPHAEGTVAVRGLNKEMIMVGHEAVGLTDPVVAFVDVWRVFRKFWRSVSSLKTGFITFPREIRRRGIEDTAERNLRFLRKYLSYSFANAYSRIQCGEDGSWTDSNRILADGKKVDMIISVSGFFFSVQ
jgi:hypothetical protein